MVKYIGFYVYYRSYQLWSTVVDHGDKFMRENNNQQVLLTIVGPRYREA